MLRPDTTGADIDRLCAEAVAHGFAAVCVNPFWVARASASLRNHPTTKVASVVGFPLGATLVDVKVLEARTALDQGATEIDMVINIGALKSGWLEIVEDELEAVSNVCRAVGARLKAILETTLLTEGEKENACHAAVRAGAAFVKTSTGFGGVGGATVADVALLRRLVGDRLGVKASGGIRDLRTLRAMLDAGATRIGTSAGPDIVRESRE